ncbi:MAG: hypothetical protein WA117_19275 [Verrucomicrobiia bacterium]
MRHNPKTIGESNFSCAWDDHPFILSLTFNTIKTRHWSILRIIAGSSRERMTKKFHLSRTPPTPLPSTIRVRMVGVMISLNFSPRDFNELRGLSFVVKSLQTTIVIPEVISTRNRRLLRWSRGVAKNNS